MLIFRNFFKTQSDQNIHQNAQNAPYFLHIPLNRLSICMQHACLILINTIIST